MNPTTQTQTETATSNHKICTTCGEPRLLTDFYDDQRCADGKYSECRYCHVRRTVSGRKLPSPPTEAEQITVSLDQRWREALDSIATPTCPNCQNQSVKANAASGRGYVCRCAHYKIFDDLMAAYEQSRASQGGVTEHRCPGFPGGRSYSRKNQEFVADVELTLKRVCRRLDEEYAQIFPHHGAFAVAVLLDGWDVEAAMRVKRLGQEWHRRTVVALNRIKVTLAKEAVELQPYALFPVKRYFAENTVINTVDSHPEHKRGMSQAFARDTTARSGARYGNGSH